MLLNIINRQKRILGIIVSFVIILNFFSLAIPEQKQFKSFDETALTSSVTYTVNNIVVKTGGPENIQYVKQSTINFEKFTKEYYKAKQVILLSKNDFSILINFQTFLTAHFSTNT